MRASCLKRVSGWQVVSRAASAESFALDFCYLLLSSLGMRSLKVSRSVTIKASSYSQSTLLVVCLKRRVGHQYRQSKRCRGQREN
jgi:hypothetical protein